MAARFWVSGGTGNWSSTTNWSATSGGSSGASVPGTADDVTLDANGNVDCTLDTGTPQCLSFTVTSGYTHKLTCTVNLFVQGGGMSLGANMTFTASTTTYLRQVATGTITSNGLTITVGLSFGSGATVTLADNWTVSGGINLGGNCTVNGNTLKVTGGTFNMGSSSMSGTTTVQFGPTGSMTWTGTGQLNNSATINTSGTLTLANGTVITYGTNTLTYTAGTVVTTGSILHAVPPCTLNTNGITWNEIDTWGNGTITNNSLLTGSLLFTNNNGTTWSGSSGWTFATLSINTGTTILVSGLTYTVSTAFTTQNTNGLGNGTIRASTVNGTKALLNYNGVRSSLNILYMTFQDIDASGGNTIWAYAPTLTRVVNISSRATGSYVPVTRGFGSIQ